MVKRGVSGKNNFNTKVIVEKLEEFGKKLWEKFQQ